MLKNRFGPMSGKSTAEPLFCVRHLIEKHRENTRNLAMIFIDLEKSFDRVPRELLLRRGFKWGVRKRK